MFNCTEEEVRGKNGPLFPPLHPIAQYCVYDVSFKTQTIIFSHFLMDVIR